MKDEIDWLHRFLNASVFGPPPSEIQRAHEIVDRLVSPEAASVTYQRGDRVLVAWPSGHLEECVVDETTIWVKDASGHAHECTLGQISKINERGPQSREESK